MRIYFDALFKLILVCLIAFSANGLAENKKPTKENQLLIDKATSSLDKCVSLNVSRVDDGVSDAMTIAKALSLKCSGETYSIVMAHIAADFGEVKDDSFYRMLLSKGYEKLSQPERFLEVVMNHRVGKKKDTDLDSLNQLLSIAVPLNIRLENQKEKGLKINEEEYDKLSLLVFKISQYPNGIDRYVDESMAFDKKLKKTRRER